MKHPKSPRRGNRLSRRLLLEPLESRTYLTAISFMDHVDLVAGSSPVAIVAADFNGDGKVDLAVADAIDENVTIFLGDGAGSFNAQTTKLALTAPAVSMIVGDFNGDGSPDLAVGTLPGANGATGVTVFINRADGTGTFNTGQFSAVRPAQTDLDSIALTAGDFDGDGHLDIATANPADNSVSILLGTGLGTFLAPDTIESGVNPTAIAAGDFNGDGKTDFVVAQQRINGTTSLPFDVLTPFIGNGAGVFTAAADVDLNTSGTLSLVAADVDGDGALDVIVGSADGNAAVFLNNGAAVFANSATVATTGPASGIAVADFDFNGTLDLASADGGSLADPGTSNVTVAAGSGTGVFPAQADFPTGLMPVSVVAADFNGDAKPDIATANSGTISILINNTAGTVTTRTTTSIVSSAPSAPFATDLQFTATVTPVSGTALPTGTVDFFDGATLLGSVDLAVGTNTVVFDTTTLGVGPHHVYAQYPGATGFTSSRSTVIAQTITPTPGNGPDLTVSFASTTLPTQFVSGETAVARFTVTNIGNTIATGRITNQLVLSLDNTVDATDIPLTVRGSLGAAFINLPAGRAVTLVGVFTVPANVPLDDYVMLYSINTTKSLLESDGDNPTNDTTASTGTFSAVDSFGTVAGRSHVLLSLPDADGTNVIYLLSGPGMGSVVVGDAGIDLTLTDTTAASSLVIINRGGGNGLVDLHDVSSAGALAVVSGATTTISGDVNLAGGARAVILKSVAGGTFTLGAGATAPVLLLGDVSNETLNAAAGIQLLSVNQWSGGGSVSAAWIGTLFSKAGAFTPNLALNGADSPGGTTLRIAVVNGAAGNDLALWNITGNVSLVSVHSFAFTGLSANISGKLTNFIDTGDFTATLAAANFGSVLIRGNLTGGQILAGANLGADGQLGGGNDSFVAGTLTSIVVIGSTTNSLVAAGLDPVDGILLNGDDQLLPGGTIKSINAIGAVDETSKFLAASLPARPRLGGAVVPLTDPRLNL